MSSNNSTTRGRPPKAPQDKRIQVNIRLLVKDRDRLQDLANQSGKPLASEGETILANYLSRRDQTNLLLDRIGLEIERLESLAHGKWHKNLMAWAAVSEMLARVLDEYRPERIADDEVVQEIRGRLEVAEKTRFAAVELLAQRGISVKLDPRPEPVLGTRRRGIFGAFLPKPQSPRQWERAAIDAMPDGIQKQECDFLFSEVLKQDALIEQIEREEDAAILPYIQAEQAGRRLVTPPNALLKYLPGLHVEDPKNREMTLAERLAKAAQSGDGEGD